MLRESKITTRARVLECPECHTLFEARRGECREVYREHEGTEFHAGCPFCGRRGAMIIKSWEYVISGVSDEAKQNADVEKELPCGDAQF